MPTFVFIKPNGLLSYSVNTETETSFQEGSYYGDLLCKLYPETLGDITVNLTTMYFKEPSFGILPIRPTDLHTWDLLTESWIEPTGYLDKIQVKNTSIVNSLASEKILATYPLWKQMNMQARFSQLLMLGEQGSTEGLALQSVWAWISSIRAASNTANEAIAIATTLEAIETIVADYRVMLAAL